MYTNTSMRSFASDDKKPHVIPTKEDIKDTIKDKATEKVKETVKEKVGLGDDKKSGGSFLTNKYLWLAGLAGAGYLYFTSSGGSSGNSGSSGSGKSSGSSGS